LGSLLHGTPAAASAKLCGAEQRVPSIFGKAGITLGNGPHSTCFCFVFVLFIFLFTSFYTLIFAFHFVLQHFRGIVLMC